MSEKMTIAEALERKSYAKATLAKLNNAIKDSIVIEKGILPRVNFETYRQERTRLLGEINTLKLAIVTANQEYRIDGVLLQDMIIRRSDLDEQLKMYESFLSESPGKKAKTYAGEVVEYVYAAGISYDNLSKQHDALRKERMRLNALIQHKNNTTTIEVEFK